MTKIDEQIIQEINEGKMKLVPKWNYLMNYWTPIFALVALLVGGILWFANANGRLFTDEKIKFETETNTVAARQRTFDKLDERYVKREEIRELKETMETLSKDLKELTKELYKLKK